VSTDSLNLEIERAWLELLEMSPRGKRTIFLTSCRRLVSGFIAQNSLTTREVGTYTRAISLEDFRADVFHVYGLVRGRHGR
jgi:hypothetical protein